MLPTRWKVHEADAQKRALSRALSRLLERSLENMS